MDAETRERLATGQQCSIERHERLRGQMRELLTISEALRAYLSNHDFSENDQNVSKARQLLEAEITFIASNMQYELGRQNVFAMVMR